MIYINPFTKRQAQLTDDGLLDVDNVLFPFKNGAIRVVESEDNYTESFGFQWNKFVKTQIDDETKSSSTQRFFLETEWDKEDLTGMDILEVGSGAGRFTNVILRNTKANLFSVDYSDAVEANFKNNESHSDRLKLFQASLYDMPFAPMQFDKVICLGVLQHTPDFKKSVEVLCSMLKPGGELVIDFYAIKNNLTKVSAKYMLRPFTKNMNHNLLLKRIESNIDWMIKGTHILHKLRLGAFSRFIPMVDLYGTLPYKVLSKAELREWCILDTFDVYSPQHDHPQTLIKVTQWVRNTGLEITHSAFLKSGNHVCPVIRAKRLII